jgi:hypothetical protein
MKNLALTLILTLTITLTACNFEEEPEQTIPQITTIAQATGEFTKPQQTTQAQSQEGEPSPTEPTFSSDMTISDLKWTLQPSLSYVELWFCPICDIFKCHKTEFGAVLAVNEKTGATSSADGAHGGGAVISVYDEERDLFGYYSFSEGFGEVIFHPFSEFMQHFPTQADKIMTVYNVDSTMIEVSEAGENLTEEAFLGKAAVAYGGKLVTDFVFDGKEFWRNSGRQAKTITAVTHNDKHGIIDKNGEVIIPFILDNILVIDENTAFARHNNKYGIISINK